DAVSIGTSNLNFLYCVRSIWYRCSGENLDRFATVYSLFKLGASGYFADQTKFQRRSRGVYGTKGITVHASAIKRRQVYVCVNVFGENSAMGLFKRDRLDVEWLDLFE